jgi:hypothetical protein
MRSDLAFDALEQALYDRETDAALVSVCSTSKALWPPEANRERRVKHGARWFMARARGGQCDRADEDDHLHAPRET